MFNIKHKKPYFSKDFVRQFDEEYSAAVCNAVLAKNFIICYN